MPAATDWVRRILAVCQSNRVRLARYRYKRVRVSLGCFSNSVTRLYYTVETVGRAGRKFEGKKEHGLKPSGEGRSFTVLRKVSVTEGRTLIFSMARI